MTTTPGAVRAANATQSVASLVKISGCIAAFAVLWFAVNWAGPVGPEWLLWVPSTAGAILVPAVYFRTSRSPGLPVPTARFWRHQAIAGVFAGLAGLTQAVDVLTHPERSGPRNGPWMMALDGIAIVVIVYSLWRIPLGRRTTNEVVRVALDAGTVMVATAAFIWHFQTRSALLTNDRGEMVLSLLLTVLALAAVLVVAKVAASSHAVINKASLRMFAVAMLVGSLGPLLQELLEARPHLLATQVSVPAVYFLAAVAGLKQQTAARKNAVGEAGESRRTFSMLPYVAVAMVDALLVYGLVTGTTDLAAIVAAVLVTTALVVLRQLVAFRDNTRLLRELDHSANHDALTQLPNRACFQDRLRAALTGTDQRPTSVALIDLDDFKEVNDTLGHEVGDALLIEVAQRLSTGTRSGDTVARLGGDEFVIVLNGADRAVAADHAERIVEALRHPFHVCGHELAVRASIGLADGRTGDDPSVLLRRADVAMYAAKLLPGSSWLHHGDEMDSRGPAPVYSPSRLRQAIDDEELFLLYQPIVAPDDGRVLGAEALVRWAHPTDGLVAPDLFVPLAERTGLIVSLTRWVLRTAFAESASWLCDEAAGDLVLNVNVSARDLREPEFAAGVAHLLAEFGIPAGRVTLEVTETVALDADQAMTTIQQLRAHGVRIALDDFGTGQSALTVLHECPVDEIKLDRSFTQALVDDRTPVAVAVIHLAQALGLHAVAEGVETPEQASQLSGLGYAAVQGYHFARPMTGADFRERIGHVLPSVVPA